ncbi:MAG: hypothetical protein JW910_22755 [Anaerolineae bacterium]|nr:hypothetical protein [Anaerolineae bacterium]
MQTSHPTSNTGPFGPIRTVPHPKQDTPAEPGDQLTSDPAPCSAAVQTQDGRPGVRVVDAQPLLVTGLDAFHAKVEARIAERYAPIQAENTHLWVLLAEARQNAADHKETSVMLYRAYDHLIADRQADRRTIARLTRDLDQAARLRTTFDEVQRMLDTSRVEGSLIKTRLLNLISARDEVALGLSKVRDALATAGYPQGNLVSRIAQMGTALNEWKRRALVAEQQLAEGNRQAGGTSC